MKKKYFYFYIYGSVFTVLFVGILSFIIFRPAQDFQENTAGSSVEIRVTQGESGISIASDLERQGVILASKTFVNLANRDKRALAISPGDHSIDKHIPSHLALDQLLDPKRNHGLVRVIEGSTVSDVLHTLLLNHIVGNVSDIKPPSGFEVARSLEGFLYPATYSFATGTTISSALHAMTDNFTSHISQTNLSKGFGKYSRYEVLTVASLIQIEADAADYPKAAQVIYNRLKIGMPLQLNSTVQYALNARGRIALSRNATQVHSPFNTYLHLGLPPSPISNPSLQAINAALHPETGDWLYFITVAPHDTRFTKSFSEFNDWVTLYNKNLAKGVFK